MLYLDFKKLECANLLFPQRARITDHEDDDSDDADGDVGTIVRHSTSREQVVCVIGFSFREL